ncbi:MAG: hypothetical protein ACRENK_10120 [Gemmatimonadaceae bacterium]
MSKTTLPKRREFLVTIAAGAVAFGLTGSVSSAFAAPSTNHEDLVPSDKWLASVTGKHRQFFDMPNHMNGMGLVQVRNYLNTLRDAYKVRNSDATAVVSLYGMTTLLAFNDAMWMKYNIGTVVKVTDANKAAPMSNVFAAAPAGAASLSLSGAPISIPADSSISALQQRGAVFLLCNNAFNLFMGMLGGDKAADVRKDFEANMLPGVFLVPAMVVAINQAQTHGCSYKYL